MRVQGGRSPTRATLRRNHTHLTYVHDKSQRLASTLTCRGRASSPRSSEQVPSTPSPFSGCVRTSKRQPYCHCPSAREAE